MYHVSICHYITVNTLDNVKAMYSSIYTQIITTNTCNTLYLLLYIHTGSDLELPTVSTEVLLPSSSSGR